MTSLSNSVQIPYTRPAVGFFPWQKHSHKTDVESVRLTISPTVTAALKRINTNQARITLQLAGKPVAGFNSEAIVSNAHSCGPYIDIINFSLKPDEQIISVGDSIGGTPPKKMASNFEKTNSLMLGANPMVDMQMTQVGPMPRIGAALALNFGSNTSKSQQMDSCEFEIKEFPDGNKKRLMCSMTKCYSEKEESIKYEIHQITTLRDGKAYDFKRSVITWVEAFDVTSDVFLNWIRYLMPDATLFTPPDTALSSIAGDWSTEYEIPTSKQQMGFTWITEVRTIFASNIAADTPYVHDYGTPWGNPLCWIATIHQVKLDLSAKIQDNKSPHQGPASNQSRNSDESMSVELACTKVVTRTLCIIGYEKKIYEIKLIENDGTKKEDTVTDMKTVEDVQHLFDMIIKL